MIVNAKYERMIQEILDWYSGPKQVGTCLCIVEDWSAFSAALHAAIFRFETVTDLSLIGETLLSSNCEFIVGKGFIYRDPQTRNHEPRIVFGRGGEVRHRTPSNRKHGYRSMSSTLDLVISEDRGGMETGSGSAVMTALAGVPMRGSLHAGMLGLSVGEGA